MNHITAACLFVCVVLLGGPKAGAQEDSRAVQIEYKARERALFPERFPWQARDGEDWQTLYSRLEALTRRAPAELGQAPESFARTCLGHEHSNVRACALLVYARHGLSLSGVLSIDGLERLAADPIPAVRQNLARALVHTAGAEADRLLLALEGDSDRAVGAEARVQLLTRGGDSLEAQLKLFAVNPFRLEADEFLGVLFAIDRLPVNEALLEGVDEILVRGIEVQGPTDQLVSRRALWAAMQHGRELAFDRTALVDGWAMPLKEDDPQLERARRERLLDGAEQGDGSLYMQLMTEAVREDQAAGGGTEDAAGARARATWYLEGALESFYKQHEFHINGRSFPISTESSEEFLIEFWSRVVGHSPSWGHFGESDFYSSSPAVRAKAFDAFAETWSRTGGSNSGRLMLQALSYPDLARQAYLTTVGANRPMANESPLYLWWKAQPPDERLELLRGHTRGVPFTPWRESLLTAWGGGSGRVVSVAELLGAFRGDKEVEELLFLWLNRELMVLEASPVPDEETTRGTWREAEARALWLTTAWMKVRTFRGSSGDRESEIQLLLRVGKLGKELGKALVGRLVQIPAGLAGTRAIVGRPELSRRVRFEILLSNPDIVTFEELSELFEGYQGCDAELRMRILRRAHGLAHATLRTFLLGVIRDSSADYAEREEAVEVLTTTGTPEEIVPLLTVILAERTDYDLRRATVAAMGKCATSLDGLGLRELYADAESRELLGDELLPAMVQIELRGSGSLSEATTLLWRNVPQEQAAAELERRFRGDALPDRDFTYNGWLRAAEALFASHQLERALGDNWWQWDARLLARLDELVREGQSSEEQELARLIDRAALVALLGEADSPDRMALILRLRLRLLQSARWGGDWEIAHGWLELLLDDWRTGRTTPNAIRSVLGSYDRRREHDPLRWMLTLEATTRAWQAFEAGRLEEAREINLKAKAQTGASSTGRSSVSRLERAMREADD